MHGLLARKLIRRGRLLGKPKTRPRLLKPGRPKPRLSFGCNRLKNGQRGPNARRPPSESPTPTWHRLTRKPKKHSEPRSSKPLPRKNCLPTRQQKAEHLSFLTFQKPWLTPNIFIPLPGRSVLSRRQTRNRREP